MGSKFEYGEKESRHTERAYLAPEVVRQRMRTLEMLGQPPLNKSATKAATSSAPISKPRSTSTRRN